MWSDINKKILRDILSQQKIAFMRKFKNKFIKIVNERKYTDIFVKFIK